eukprot:7326819-Prymnesium_polylepis.1
MPRSVTRPAAHALRSQATNCANACAMKGSRRGSTDALRIDSMRWVSACYFRYPTRFRAERQGCAA